MPVNIRVAVSAGDYATFGALIREYVDWCRARYEHDRAFVDAVFGQQSLDHELRNLAISYGPSNGRTLIAERDGVVQGAGAYRRLSDGICEMKRLFVPSRFQGQGIGRRLSEAIMAAAKEDGYDLVRLDTADRLVEAIALYKALGFRDCAPYHQYPAEIMPRIVFMERRLREGSGERH